VNAYQIPRYGNLQCCQLKVHASFELGFCEEISHKRRFSFSSRDNKTAIELFLTGIRGWDAGLQRQIAAGKSNPD